MKREIIVLTKSAKRGEFCVAGIDRSTGEWVRVVSNNISTEYAVPKRDLICDNGNEAEIYDIIEIDFIEYKPTSVQSENYLYNSAIKWRYIGKSNKDEVINIHGYDNPEYVFENTDHRLEESELGNSGVSLLLLKVDRAKYSVKCFSERKVLNLQFYYKNRRYHFFRVTQQNIDLRDKAEGQYATGTDTFVFSLTNKYNRDNKYYKVVAQALV